MKKLLLILTFATAVVNSQAQDNLMFDNPDNEPYFGARIGFDITSTPGNKVLGDYSNGGGFSFGGYYNIPVYKNLYVEPGLSMFYDTFSEDIAFGDEHTSLPLPTISRSFRNFGFRIPLVGGYRFDFTDDVSISLFTGPQLNVSLYAHDKYSGLPSDVADNENFKGENLFGHNGFNHLDLQWAFGGQVTYDRYSFNVSGGVGLTKAYNDGKDKIRRNTLTLSIGYRF